MAGTSGINDFSAYGSTPKPMADMAPAGKWSAQADPYKAAYSYFTSTDGTKGANSALSEARNAGLLGSSFDKTSQKFTDGLKDLYSQNLSPEDFKKKENALMQTCSPRPGIKQLSLGQLTNLQNQLKSGKMSKADFSKAVDKLQTSFSVELQADAYIDQQICNVDSFDYQSVCAEKNKAEKEAADG